MARVSNYSVSLIPSIMHTHYLHKKALLIRLHSFAHASYRYTRFSYYFAKTLQLCQAHHDYPRRGKSHRITYTTRIGNSSGKSYFFLLLPNCFISKSNCWYMPHLWFVRYMILFMAICPSRLHIYH